MPATRSSASRRSIRRSSRAPARGSSRASPRPAAAEAAPLRADEFARLVRDAGLRPRPDPLAVAVSGGADSLALAFLAAAWARETGRPAVALTVDHGLRPGSAAEAAEAGARARAMGLPHHVLPWRHGPVAAGVQAAAREARLGLLLGWCRARGVPEILFAHHLGDQAETFLLRLAAGSGPAGLAAMRPRARLRGVDVVRPLLDVPAARLRATLRAAGIPWAEDPSNRDPRHARVRARRLLAAARPPLPPPGRLAAAAAAFARLDGLLAAALRRALGPTARVSPLGALALDRASLARLPAPLARRALADAVRAAAGRAYPPRGRRLDALAAAALGGGDPPARTLAGALVTFGPREILFEREEAAVAPPLALAAGGSGWWDGRFRVENRCPGEAFEVGALGAAGARELRDLGVPGAAGRPAHAAPAFRDVDGIAAAPHLGWWRERGLRDRLRAAFDPPVPPAWARDLPAGGGLRQDGAPTEESA